MTGIYTPGRFLALHEVGYHLLTPVHFFEAWKFACQFWQIYGYTAPRVNRSIRDGKGEHDTQLAYINFAQKRVTVNLHRLEQAGLLDLLEAVLVHELGHKICPGTLKDLLLINTAICEVFSDQQTAQMIGNLFRDMIVNTEAHRRGDRGIQQVYARLWKNSLDPIIQVIGRAYEIIFQEQDTSMRYRESIIKQSIIQEIEKTAKSIAELIKETGRANWLKNARKFALLIQPLIPPQEMRNSDQYVIFSSVSPQDFSPPGASPIPPKGKSDQGELQKRLGGSVYDLQQLEKDKKNKPCTLDRFKQFLLDNNIRISDEATLIWYYRELAGGNVVKTPEIDSYTGALYPYAPTTWQPSDPPHILDVPVSIACGGILIPGYTTKRWILREGVHTRIGRDYPDLDLWIDSSGSMTNPATGNSHAVTSAMIVSHSFLATGKAVRVVNWSSDNAFFNTGNFVRDKDTIDQALIRYLDGGTCIPIEEFEKPYLEEIPKKTRYIVLITDLHIRNLCENTIDRLTICFKRACGGTVFLIGSDNTTMRDMFRSIGFDVVQITDPSQLNQRAMELNRRLFEESLAT